MKKSLTLATILMTVLMLQSCLKDNDDFYPVVVGTTKIVDNDISTTQFLLDTGYKLSPTNIQDLNSKELKNNQRVFLQLKDVEEDSSKKELKATIILVVKIKTQKIEFTENIDSANKLLATSDPVNIGDAYIINGFLTLKYHYRGIKNADSHKFNLYAVKDIETDKENAYKLYLTHDAVDDLNGEIQTLFMSFPIENIQDQIDLHNKTVVTYKTYYSGNADYTVFINKKK